MRVRRCHLGRPAPSRPPVRRRSLGSRPQWPLRPGIWYSANLPSTVISDPLGMLAQDVEPTWSDAFIAPARPVESPRLRQVRERPRNPVVATAAPSGWGSSPRVRSRLCELLGDGVMEFGGALRPRPREERGPAASAFGSQGSDTLNGTYRAASPAPLIASSSVNRDPANPPRARDAVIPTDKLIAYALNSDHPRGRHKARVFRSALGIRPGRLALLARSTPRRCRRSAGSGDAGITPFGFLRTDALRC